MQAENGLTTHAFAVERHTTKWPACKVTEVMQGQDETERNRKTLWLTLSQNSIHSLIDPAGDILLREFLSFLLLNLILFTIATDTKVLKCILPVDCWPAHEDFFTYSISYINQDERMRKYLGWIDVWWSSSITVRFCLPPCTLYVSMNQIVPGSLE